MLEHEPLVKATGPLATGPVTRLSDNLGGQMMGDGGRQSRSGLRSTATHRRLRKLVITAFTSIRREHIQ